MTDELKRAEMRALVVEAHAGQSRNAGKVPYVAHVLSVGEILRECLDQGGECSDPALALDLFLAALGHDLYEDTKVTPDDIRQRFGARVDRLIEGMTNRAGDQDRAAYEARMGGGEEEIRLIKLADLIDNVASCAYGIHDLGLHWVRDTFMPIAVGMTEIVSRATYQRYGVTAKVMLARLDFVMSRIRANLAIAQALEPKSSGVEATLSNWAKWDGKLKVKEGDLEKQQERERREGWLVKGMRVFAERG